MEWVEMDHHRLEGPRSPREIKVGLCNSKVVLLLSVRLVQYNDRPLLDIVAVALSGVRPGMIKS